MVKDGGGNGDGFQGGDGVILFLCNNFVVKCQISILSVNS